MAWGRDRESAAPERGGPVAPTVEPTGPAVTASQASLLSLQRSAGNGAVGAVLHRAPSDDAGAAVEAILRRAPADGAAPAPEAAPTTPEESYAAHMEGLYSKEFMDLGKGEKGDGVAVDAKKADADLAELKAKLKKVPALEGTIFYDFIEAYVDSAKAGDAGMALENMYTALAALNSVGAFTVADTFYRRLDRTPTEAEVAPLRERAMNNVHLWSKLNKYKAIEAVKGGEDGVTLESTAAGALFDGLTFGMHYGSNKVLGQQWKMVSKTFVAQSAKVVHVQVLRGIDKQSVFYTVEKDEVFELIKEKKVQKLVVHFFDFVDGQLVESKPAQDVYTPEQLEALPQVSKTDGTDYAKVQQAVQDSENARNDPKQKAQAASVAAEPARVEEIG